MNNFMNRLIDVLCPIVALTWGVTIAFRILATSEDPALWPIVGAVGTLVAAAIVARRAWRGRKA